MTLFHATDFADRLENEIVPALRAGLVVLTDSYVFSIMARALSIATRAVKAVVIPTMRIITPKTRNVFGYWESDATEMRMRPNETLTVAIA